MKKIATLTTLMLSTIILTACGNNNSKSSKSSTTTVMKPATPKYYFKGNVLKIHDLKIKITKTEIIPVGQKGNEYGDKPVLAFWYDTTNYTGKEIDPNTAWSATFDAYQDTSSSQVHKLEVSALPDDQFLDSQTEAIKKNKTAPNAVAYSLDSNSIPVKLKGIQGESGKVLGTKTIKIQAQK